MAGICVREEAVMFLVRLHLELIFSSSWNIDQLRLFPKSACRIWGRFETMQLEEGLGAGKRRLAL